MKFKQKKAGYKSWCSHHQYDLFFLVTVSLILLLFILMIKN